LQITSRQTETRSDKLAFEHIRHGARVFDKLLAEIRMQGLACVKGDLVPGVHAIAAPLFDHKERIAGVIGVLGRSEELDVDYQGAVAKALRSSATEISRRLGRPGTGT